MLITIEVSEGIRDRLAEIADRRRVSIAEALSQLVAEEEAREHGVSAPPPMTNLRRERTQERGRGEPDGERQATDGR